MAKDNALGMEKEMEIGESATKLLTGKAEEEGSTTILEMGMKIANRSRADIMSVGETPLNQSAPSSISLDDDIV